MSEKLKRQLLNEQKEESDQNEISNHIQTYRFLAAHTLDRPLLILPEHIPVAFPHSRWFVENNGKIGDLTWEEFSLEATLLEREEFSDEQTKLFLIDDEEKRIDTARRHRSNLHTWHQTLDSAVSDDALPALEELGILFEEMGMSHRTRETFHMRGDRLSRHWFIKSKDKLPPDSDGIQIEPFAQIFFQFVLNYLLRGIESQKRSYLWKTYIDDTNWKGDLNHGTRWFFDKIEQGLSQKIVTKNELDSILHRWQKISQMHDKLGRNISRNPNHIAQYCDWRGSEVIPSSSAMAEMAHHENSFYNKSYSGITWRLGEMLKNFEKDSE